MRADMGSLSWLSVDVSIQNRLWLHRPGDSRFGVSVYPPPGQSVHTLTPACQRREQQEITGERTERERERVFQSKRQRERVFMFFLKSTNPSRQQ